MSPEQFSGQTLDARSDIYSLGVMTYEMLTGHLPFDARTPWEWATKHLTAPPTPLETHAVTAQLPNRKKAAIMRALAKNRDERQATVMEFLNEFTGIQDAQAAWTMATHAGMASGSNPPPTTPPMNTAPQMPVSRPAVGTPQPMHSEPGTQPLYPSQPSSMGYDAAMTGGMGMSSGHYQTGGQPQQGGGMGKWLAIVAALVVFVGGAAAVLVVWMVSQTPDTTTIVAQPQPVAPPSAPLGVQVNPVQQPAQPYVPPAPPTQVQPTVIPLPVVPTPTPEVAVPTPPATEPAPTTDTTPSSDMRGNRNGNASAGTGDRAAGQAALASARAAVGQNDVERAITSLRTAQRALGNGDSDVASVRGQLAQRGGTKVGILIQMGRCDQARSLYRQLNGVGAGGGARQHFGDWCRP